MNLPVTQQVGNSEDTQNLRQFKSTLANQPSNRKGATFTGRRHQPAPRTGSLGTRRRISGVNGGKKLR